MKVTYRVRDHFKEVGRENIDKFAQDILRLEESDIEEVTIDFQGVNYLSSMGIGSLFSLAQGIRERKGKLEVINVEGTLKKIFELAGLATFLENL